MTSIVLKGGKRGPDPEAVKILSGLVPAPHEYDLMLPTGGKEPYMLLWRLLGAHLNGEDLNVGTESDVRRNRRRIFEPAIHQLRKLGWDVSARIKKAPGRTERDIFLTLKPSDRAPAFQSTAWKIAPSPEQVKLLLHPHNEELTRIVWLFVKQISEGHNTVDLGRVDTMHTWVAEETLTRAKDIVLSRNWSAYSLRSKPTKQRPHVRLCLKLFPKFIVDFDAN
jgi:hypothetical protein